MTQHLSASLKFAPSLAIIPEEEPRILYFRTITVVPISREEESFQVKIPIYNVNVYSPSPPEQPISSSYQRLLDEMDAFIRKSERSEQYRQMADALRKRVAHEQAERWRTSESQFTDRDWYWYSEKTGSFSDVPVDEESVDGSEVLVTSSEQDEEEDKFDLTADF